MRAQFMERGGNKGWSVKWFGFRWWWREGGWGSPKLKKKQTCYCEKKKITLSVGVWSAQVFFFSHCGRDEITSWPITWVAARTLLWDSDYYWLCGTCSTEPSNPWACGWSCGMLLTSVIWPDPPLKGTWLSQGSLHRRGGRRCTMGQREGVVWSGEELDMDLLDMDVWFSF